MTSFQIEILTQAFGPAHVIYMDRQGRSWRTVDAHTASIIAEFFPEGDGMPVITLEWGWTRWIPASFRSWFGL